MLGSQKTPEEQQSRVSSLASVSAAAERIENEIIATLPSSYSISDFDEQFDIILSSIPIKCEELRL
ncbi:hypothetical protein EMCG_06516, partial [[Emmonsia] crescens]